jgi:hypothetical protein
MIQKSVFAIQPFLMGGGQKNHKSLAVVIPAAVVREFNLSRDTILALRIDQGSKKMTLEPLQEE